MEPILKELVSPLLDPSMMCKLGFPDYLAEVLPEPPASKLSLEVRYTSAEPILMERMSLLLDSSMLCKLGVPDYLADALPESPTLKL